VALPGCTGRIPSFVLRYVGCMIQASRYPTRLARKVTIFILILLMDVVFYIVEFGQLMCPNFDKAWTTTEVAEHTGDSDWWVVAASMRLSVLVSTTRLPLTNIPCDTFMLCGFNLLFTPALDYPTICYRWSRPAWRAPCPVCPEQGSYQQYVLYPMSISPPSRLTCFS
jgi:hypothetical protein